MRFFEFAMKKRLGIVLSLFLFSFSVQLSAQNCWESNTAFQSGERIDYTIYYHLAGIWVRAGEVYFKADTHKIAGEPYWHFDSYGRTFSKYDWIYRVRDHYQTYTHYEKLQPSIFRRKVEEGSDYIWENYDFNYQQKVAFTKRQLEKDAAFEYDTVSIKNCSYDVLSMIYYARNIDFSQFEKDDKIPINIFIDNAAYDSYIRFLGKEKKKIKGIGVVDCIAFSPYLIEGSIFNAGEDMTVYVSDDQNRVPLLIETPILVGTIKAVINKVQHLRHPTNVSFE